MTEKRKYDSTIARIAGNIAAGIVDGYAWNQINIDTIAANVVALARAIVAEIERTEPRAE